MPEGAAGLEKGHKLAFVVGGAARHDLLALRSGLELRLERRVAPEIQGIDRLHVVVAIEQDMRRLAAAGLDMADDHRPALGRALGGLETELAELGDQPVRRPLAIGEMRRNGGNRRDRQQGEQPLERRPLVGVDRSENVVNRGHALRLSRHRFRRLVAGVACFQATPTPDLGRLAKRAAAGDNRASGGRRRMAQPFDAGHAPFNRLTAEEIGIVRAALDIGYFRPDETIIARDGAPDSLFIVIKGCVEERDHDEVVALRGPGDAFDSRALVQGGGSNAFVAREETLCNLLPRDVTLRLINQNPRFASFFYLDISRKLDAALREEEGARFAPLMKARVSDLVLLPATFIDATESIAAPARGCTRPIPTPFRARRRDGPAS